MVRLATVHVSPAAHLRPIRRRGRRHLVSGGEGLALLSQACAPAIAIAIAYRHHRHHYRRTEKGALRQIKLPGSIRVALYEVISLGTKANPVATSLIIPYTHAHMLPTRFSAPRTGRTASGPSQTAC